MYLKGGGKIPGSEEPSKGSLQNARASRSARMASGASWGQHRQATAMDATRGGTAGRSALCGLGRPSLSSLRRLMQAGAAMQIQRDPDSDSESEGEGGGGDVAMVLPNVGEGICSQVTRAEEGTPSWTLGRLTISHLTFLILAVH